MRKCDQLQSKKRALRCVRRAQAHRRYLRGLPSLLGMFGAFKRRSASKRAGMPSRAFELFRYAVSIGLRPKTAAALSGFPWLTGCGTPRFDAYNMPATAPRIRIRL